MNNPLTQLGEAGQAVWLDFVDRAFLRQGGLKRLIENDGLTGVTSNPSLFMKAMSSGDDYDEGFRAVLTRADASPLELYESQAIADMKAAAADLRPVYDQLLGRDGYVSLEVSPNLAEDTRATIEEAHRLWHAVGAPNLMIKIPGTQAGALAIPPLIEAGININVTLLFSQQSYLAVADAYLTGLEARLAKAQPVNRIASVASFFVSRIDVRIDKMIDERIDAGDAESTALKGVRGKVAIANAKLAYAAYCQVVASDRWRKLAIAGAMPQRLLWASTAAKDPAYADTLYIDALVAPDTVNTMPPTTMDAFRDHGTVRAMLSEDVNQAHRVLAEVDRLQLNLEGVTAELVSDGLKQFVDAANSLLTALAIKCDAFNTIIQPY